MDWDYLSQTRFSSGHIAPLLDDWFLDLPWVSARTGADFLRNVNTLLSRLEKRNKLGNMLALLLGLQVASLLWCLRYHSFGSGKALLWSWLQNATGWTTKLTWDLLAVSL